MPTPTPLRPSKKPLRELEELAKASRELTLVFVQTLLRFEYELRLEKEAYSGNGPQPGTYDPNRKAVITALPPFPFPAAIGDVVAAPWLCRYNHPLVVIAGRKYKLAAWDCVICESNKCQG